MNAFPESGSSPRVARWTANVTACVLLWISRTLFGLLVIFPILQAVKATGMVSGPDGDSVLFRSGSLLLLEMFRVGAPGLGAALSTALLLSGVAMLAQLLPLTVALDLLSFDGARLSARFRRAFELLPGLLGLGGVAILTQAALLLVASLLSAALKSPLQGGDERVATVAPFALLVLALIGCGWVGCILDIARAALVSREQSFGEALSSALTCVRRKPLEVLAGGYPVAAASTCATLCCMWLTARLDLAHQVPRSLVLSFLAHQAAVLFAVAWRVRWLRHTLTLDAGSDR